MKGLLTYVLPKVVKTIAGLAVGAFVFYHFVQIYEWIYPQVEAAIHDHYDAIRYGVEQGNNAVTEWSWVALIQICNLVLPIETAFYALSLYVPAAVAISLMRLVFKVLDIWMKGVLALTAGLGGKKE